MYLIWLLHIIELLGFFGGDFSHKLYCSTNTSLTKLSYTYMSNWYWCRGIGTYFTSTSTVLNLDIGTDTQYWYTDIQYWYQIRYPVLISLPITNNGIVTDTQYWYCYDTQYWYRYRYPVLVSVPIPSTGIGISLVIIKPWFQSLILTFHFHRFLILLFILVFLHICQ